MRLVFMRLYTPLLVLFVFFPGVFLHSRVTGVFPVTTDLSICEHNILVRQLVLQADMDDNIRTVVVLLQYKN